MTATTPETVPTPASADTAPPAPSAKPPRRIDKTFYVMLFPVVALFTLFITVPAVVGMFYSVTNYVGYGNWEFTGLTNYIAIFSDPRILRSYGFTLGFSIVTVVVVNVIALALALGLSAKIKLKTALRGVFFIPMVISGIVIAYVFNYLFSTSLPTIAASLGIGSLETSILANERLAWIAIVVVTAWQAVPGAMIIYLAGLLAIPNEVYEAASIDGAKPWRQFRSITFPLVLGYVVINTILGLKGFLNAYDIIVGLTNGGPGTATMSVAMTIFTGFTSGDYAYQMANAVLFFVVTVVISLLQLRLIQRRGVSL
ncbi:MAG TPA: sugar ABC transporter permease [Micromonosporaceae bacterium]|nr:sugar ABC transporter permease [Micromonosporaceae bacterium]